MGTHRIQPARLKPGVTLADLPGPAPPTPRPSGGSPRTIRGRALDLLGPDGPRQEARRDRHRPDHAGRRLRLREPRHPRRALEGGLLPPPHAGLPQRVHRGETFVIAGRPLRDRLLARDEPGRARRASPRRRASSWSSSAATTWATSSAATPSTSASTSCRARRRSRTRRTATPSTFDPATRALTNETRGKTYAPVAALAKEEEIRRGGGIFAVGRREFRATRSSARPRSAGRTPRPRARLTATEQIVWAHRVDRDADVRAGRDAARLRGPAARLRRHGALRDPHVQPDHRRRVDLPAAGGDRQRPLRLHRQGRRREADLDRPRVRARPRHREAVLRDARRRHLPLLLSRAGARPAGAVHPGRGLAQPRLRRLRRGRLRRRLDDARASAGRPATSTSRSRSSGASCFAGALQPWVIGQGHRARAPAALGREAVGGDVRRVRGRGPAAADRLPQHDRQHDGRGGGAERHLRAGRRSPRRGTGRRGIADLPYPRVAPGADAVYAIDEKLDARRDRADDRQALLARATRSPREEVARERLTFDKAMIGSCTNGSYDDLLHGGARAARRAREGFPQGRAGRSRSSRARAASDARSRAPDPRLDGESIAEVFRSARRRDPPVLVRPLLRPGPRRADAGPARDHVASIATGRTAWASAARATSPAPRSSRPRRCSGYMAPPAELGLTWEPARFGVTDLPSAIATAPGSRGPCASRRHHAPVSRALAGAREAVVVDARADVARRLARERVARQEPADLG